MRSNGLITNNWLKEKMTVKKTFLLPKQIIGDLIIEAMSVMN